jgi:hypothetical protein
MEQVHPPRGAGGPDFCLSNARDLFSPVVGGNQPQQFEPNPAPALVRSIPGSIHIWGVARNAQCSIRTFYNSKPIVRALLASGSRLARTPQTIRTQFCPSGLGAPADDLNSTSRDNSNPIRRRPRFVVTIRSQSSLPRRGWRLTRIAQTIRTQFAHQGSARRPTISTQPAVTIRTQSAAGPGSSLQFVFTIRSQSSRRSSPRVAVHGNRP